MLSGLVYSFLFATAMSNYGGHPAAIQATSAAQNVRDQPPNSVASAPQQTGWTQQAWCNALADQVTFLLVEAHAPILAARASCSLEQCSEQSQQIFRHVVAAQRQAKLHGLDEASDGEEVSLRDKFAEQRSLQAQQFLAQDRVNGLSRCACLAHQLEEPENSVAHEHLFVDFLACIAKGGH